SRRVVLTTLPQEPPDIDRLGHGRIFSRLIRPTQKRSEPSRRLGVGGYRDGSRQRAVPATPPAALRNISALSAQALAGIQERLADCIQIDDNSRHEYPKGGSCCAAFTLFASSAPPSFSPARGRLSRRPTRRRLWDLACHPTSTPDRR